MKTVIVAATSAEKTGKAVGPGKNAKLGANAGKVDRRRETDK